MSTLEEKRKKLLALRAQTRSKHKDKNSRLAELRAKRMGLNKESTLGSTMDESLLTQKEEPQEPESNLTMQSHIGILNITSKKPNYKYDRGVSVTKEELDLFHLLNKEAEDQALPPPMDPDQQKIEEEEFS